MFKIPQKQIIVNSDTQVRLLEDDGTAYAGWQAQLNALAVQQVVESALMQILRKEIRIHSSGRTDAGVHARGMMVHFQTESNRLN